MTCIMYLLDPLNKITTGKWHRMTQVILFYVVSAMAIKQTKKKQHKGVFVLSILQSSGSCNFLVM